MDNRMIVTNLRINESDWREVKLLAGEAGISVNEYVKRLIREFAVRKEFGIRSEKHSIEVSNIWNLSKLAKKKGKKLNLSIEDKLIYES